jgi:hypothetical protein
MSQYFLKNNSYTAEERAAVVRQLKKYVAADVKIMREKLDIAHRISW